MASFTICQLIKVLLAFRVCLLRLFSGTARKALYAYETTTVSEIDDTVHTFLTGDATGHKNWSMPL